MSLEEQYRKLNEAAGSRPRDQKADVPANGNVEETPEQKSKGGDAHANRKQDKKGTGHDAVGETPKETDMGIGKQPDMKSTFSMEEAEKCDDDEEEDDSEEMEESKVKKAKKMTMKEFKLSDELGSLLEAEGLDESFKEKAVSIFEAAVNAAAATHIESINEEAAQLVSEEVEAYKAELDEQVEKYLDYVVAEWIEENQLAIESSSRNQVAESFMEGLRDLLEKHYIELPTDKVDMYEAEVQRSQEIAESLQEAVDKNIELQSELQKVQAELSIERFTSGMTVVEAEKIRELAEGVEFVSAEQFEAKLNVLKENFFPEVKANKSSLTEDEDVSTLKEDTKVEQVGNDMSAYLKTLSTMKVAK